MTPPVTVTAARARGLATYERRFAAWAVSESGPEAAGSPPAVALDLPLHPPTEADALADEAVAIAWVRSWVSIPGVVWGSRRWASLGEQRVPERLLLDVPALAAFVGRTAHWRTLSGRAGVLLDRWGDGVGPVLRRHARSLADQDEADHARLVAVVDWLLAHPASGLYLRQLPVAGVDTKWLERRISLVTAIIRAQGLEGLGLREPPGLVRLRFGDSALAPGGLHDLAAPVEELDGLGVVPGRVLVVENLQTMLAVPARPGLVVVHGTGYAVNRLADVGWIRDARILYWGDLDGDGFTILDRLRAHCPRVDSLLMDSRTLLAHRDLWGADPNRPPGNLPQLTAAEAATVTLLAELGGVRLEQERLAWPACLDALDGALGT